MNNLNTLNFNNLFKLNGFFLIFKLVFLIADFFAIVFLLIVIRQILSMDHIIHASKDFAIIKMFALLLLLITISLFIVSLVIL